MCGIVGYVGPRQVRPLLFDGLKKLEYRGYDSAGISVLDGDHIDLVRAVGNLDFLRAAIDAQEGLAANGNGRANGHAGGNSSGSGPGTGIGHTRWATHGRPTEANAHPHYSTNSRIHIAVNGIVENYIALRESLVGGGAVFTSETDAEVIAHLISKHYDGDLAEAVRAAYKELHGHYAFVAMSADDPGVLVGARKECPLVVGRGDGEQFIGSAVPAFLSETNQVQYMNDDEIVILRPSGVEFTTVDGDALEREISEIDWDADTAEKGGYETFMLKEINEQADAVADTIGERAADDHTIDLGDLGTIDDDLLRRIERIVVVACGTSYHAGLAGRYAIEAWARVPVEVEIASEYRYRNPVVSPTDLVIGVSQSGETADTLAAMRTAKRGGANVLAVCNVMGSQMTRDADGVLYTRAGTEIGVAATKTFVTQVVAFHLFALRLAELRGALPGDELTALIREVKQLPHLISATLEGGTDEIERIAAGVSDCDFFMYLGRNAGLPIALEGALKLKEISYVATDAYPAGEMKHGPIALLDETTPVVAVATESPVLEKLVSNIQEVRARGARVIGIATEGDTEIAQHCDEVIRVPRTHWMLNPLLAVIPLQLLAYFIASRRGLNVDQPRNLAKTVTVE
jgi:glutamine---fructose-6-phosphate transaminase (isomerizing)